MANTRRTDGGQKFFLCHVHVRGSVNSGEDLGRNSEVVEKFPKILDTVKGEALSSREQPVTCATDGGRISPILEHALLRSGQTISDIDKKESTEEEIPATVAEGAILPA